jgi:alginate O-acetyltransferase complex protein AlgJ
MNSLTGVIRRAGYVLIIIVFAGTLALPLAASLLGLAPRPRLQEKRRLAEAPEFRFKGPILAKFPAKFEAYYNDNFAFRDQLVRWHNLVKVRALKVSPRPNVLIGKKGWLYYQEGLLDHDHAITPLTDHELSQWVQLLEERREWLATRGIRFLVVIPPDKHTVYPEYLPDWVRGVGLSPRLDQLLAYVREHSNVTIVDIRPSLRQAKGEDRLYQMTDTHWNYRGAFAADRSIAEVLARWYPEVQPLSRPAFSPAPTSWPGDLAEMLGLSNSFKEENLLLEPLQAMHSHVVSMADAAVGKTESIFEAANPALPRAVMFHDSFGCCLYPFLAEHFRRIAYHFTKTHGFFDTQLIEREKPDVVIWEFVERRLVIDALPTNPAEVAGAKRTKSGANSLVTGSNAQ